MTKSAIKPAVTAPAIRTYRGVKLQKTSGQGRFSLTKIREAVGDKAVHLSAVTGQELFDAVVLLEDVSAVLIRTGGK